MGGFLQRLASRAAPGAGGGLRPAVRSTSPIASHDQRLGLPGFEGVGLGRPGRGRAGEPVGASGFETAGRGPWADAAGGAGPGVREPAEATSAAVPGVRTPAAASVPPPASPSPEPTSPGVGIEPRGSVGTRGARAPSREDAVPSATGPRAQAPGALAVRSLAGPAGGAERADGPGRARLAPDAPLASGPAPARSSASAAAAAGTGPPRLAPSPPRSEAPDAPAARRRGTPTGRADPGLRLEIGAIHVEVVPPPAPPAAAPPPPRGPLTAESVSRIGPLAAGRPSNLRFAVRRR